MIRFRRRHHFIFVRRKNAFYQFTFLWLAGDDRAFFENYVAVIQAQLGFPLILVVAVASKAVFGEDRADIAIEPDGIGLSVERRGERSAKKRSDAEKKLAVNV